MAKTIEHMDFYVAIAPYKTAGNGEQEFNTLRVSVNYTKGRGFRANYHPGWTSGIGYGCLFDFSNNPLTSTTWVDIEPTATKNNVKKLEQYKVNLEVGKEAIAWLFDHREWQKLNAAIANIAKYGYTESFRKQMADMMTENNNTNNTSNEQVMETKKNNNESANVQNAQVNNPMMKQFRDLKAKHPERILLFRCGDFYETYEQDAADVAEVLGITLTKGDDGVQMAGFPHHALDSYLPKLIRAGKHVAICDQLEKPKPKGNDNANDNVNANPNANATKAEKPKSEKPKVKKTKSEKPKAKANDNVNANAPLVYETYTNKKGKTCARIKGFTEDDARYQSGPELHGSKTWERDKKGNKTYMLVFGPVYVNAAKQLCEAWNNGDAAAISKAVEDVNGTLDAHRKEREAQRAEYKAKKAANTTTKSEGCYTKEDVAAMLQKVMAGEDIPEDIKRLLSKAA